MFALCLKITLLPQRFVLPSTGEAHGGCVDGWVVGKKRIDFGLHVVMGRNDVQEILDDAEVKVNSKRICWQIYPVSSHTVGKHRTYGILLVPNTSMVATGIAGQGDNGKPRFEWCHLQAKSPCNAFLDSGDLDVAEDVSNDSEGEHFGQYPGWRVSIGIGLLEVDNEIFA